MRKRCENEYQHSCRWFCSYAGYWLWFLTGRNFFLTDSSNPFIAHSRYSFDLWILLELQFRTLLLYFFISSSKFLLRPYDFKTTSNMLLVHSFIRFELKWLSDIVYLFLVELVFFVRMTKFLGQARLSLI